MSSLITPEATISYPNLFKARLGKNAKPGDRPKFSATLLFTAAAMETAEFKAMQAAVVQCAREKWGDKADAMIREGAVRLPFRKDVTTKGHPAEYACFVNINSSEENPPAVVGRDAKPITDQKEIYAGAKVRVSLGVYAYGGKGTDYTPGIAFGLRNVQKLADGPRIDGRANASDEFGALDPLPPAGHPDAEMAALLQ